MVELGRFGISNVFGGKMECVCVRGKDEFSGDFNIINAEICKQSCCGWTRESKNGSKVGLYSGWKFAGPDTQLLMEEDTLEIIEAKLEASGECG